MNFPRAIREHLAGSKARGVPFDDAWDSALRAVGPPPVDERGPWLTVMPFMRQVMAAAYAGSSRYATRTRLEPLTHDADGVRSLPALRQGHGERVTPMREARRVA